MIKDRKILFVHDGPIHYDNKENKYYGVSYSNNLVKRYLTLGNSVTFLMRAKEVKTSQAKHLNHIDEPALSFVEIPNYKSFTKYIYLKGKAEKIIEREVNKHDIIVVRLPSSSGAIAVKYAKQKNKPLLAEMVACTWDAYWNYSWKGKLVAPYFYFKLKKRIKNLPYVIYVTKHFLQDRYPTNGKSIHISNVELKISSNKVLDERLNRISKWNEKQPLTLMTVAALNVSYKGQVDVIKAIHKLKNKGIYYFYKLIGQGSHKNIKKLIIKLKLEEHVEIIGSLPHEKVFNMLEKADIYVQPSKQEGLPRAVIEAMSKACPVLGANTGGIPELISKDCIFKKGNVKQIEKMLSIIDKNRLIRMSKENYEEAKEYTPSILNERRANYYEKFIKENGL